MEVFSAESTLKAPVRDASLELKSSHVTKAVNTFITIKVAQPAARKRYGEDTHKYIVKDMEERAEGTFLWVSVVCMAFEQEPARRASKVVRTFPAGLEPLYERMLIMAQQHEDDEEVGLRRQLLRVMVPSSQPLQVDEIRTIAGLEHELADAVAVEEATMVCGSFLTLRNATVAWIHQSAKDFFTGGNGMCIFSNGIAATHAELGKRCITIMSKHLERDLCKIDRPGAQAREGRKVLEKYLPPAARYRCFE